MEIRNYDVIIDRSSTTITVRAKTKVDAEKKALEEFEKYDIKADYEYWVGECDEVIE